MKKRAPEKLLFTVIKGGLVPADGYTSSRLAERRYSIGDKVLCVITKPRNPRFHRLAHQLGKLLCDNLDVFEHSKPHDVIKRLQIESGAGCDEISVIFPGIGPCVYRVPRSISFESMDETEFHDVFTALFAHVCKTYWPSMMPGQVEEMALLVND